MGDADRRLSALREAGGRAHLLGDRLGDIAEPLLVLGLDALQQVDALFPRGLGVGREGLAGGGDGLVDIGGGAGRDVSADLFGGGVDDIEALGGDRIDPLTIDVKFHVFAHAALPEWRSDVALWADPTIPLGASSAGYMSDRGSSGKTPRAITLLFPDRPCACRRAPVSLEGAMTLARNTLERP